MVMDNKLKGLRYYGGKNATNPVGAWIASMLPLRKAYVEPFCGMAGVLLRRPESRYEYLNDHDKFIYTWWKTVRDNSHELARKLKFTPLSEQALEDAYEVLHDPESHAELDVAVAVTVKLTQSYLASTGLRRKPSWLYTDAQGKSSNTFYEQIVPLSNRMRNVALYNRDGLDIIERFANRGGECVMYLDPPYYNARTDAWDNIKDTSSDIINLLSNSTSLVAVSGYDDQYDELGWRRLTRKTTTNIHAKLGENASERTEVLWVNYDPELYPTRKV